MCVCQTFVISAIVLATTDLVLANRIYVTNCVQQKSKKQNNRHKFLEIYVQIKLQLNFCLMPFLFRLKFLRLSYGDRTRLINGSSISFFSSILCNKSHLNANARSNDSEFCSSSRSPAQIVLSTHNVTEENATIKYSFSSFIHLFWRISGT